MKMYKSLILKTMSAQLAMTLNLNATSSAYAQITPSEFEINLSS